MVAAAAAVGTPREPLEDGRARLQPSQRSAFGNGRARLQPSQRSAQRANPIGSGAASEGPRGVNLEHSAGRVPRSLGGGACASNSLAAI